MCIRDRLKPRGEQRASPVRFERLHVHRPIPARAHDLREPFGIVPVGLVDLHLQRRTRMPSIQADNRQRPSAQLMYQPRCHRARLDADLGVVSGMPNNSSRNLIRQRAALTAPDALATMINNADCGGLQTEAIVVVGPAHTALETYVA